MEIILASQSPRRRKILNKHGIEPIVMPADIDETLPDDISCEEAVKMLALKKATAVYEQIKDNPQYNDSIVIGSDTVVYKDKIMGKPLDAADAFSMLSSIRNTHHYVATGVAIIDVRAGKEKVLCDTTTVYCKNYSDEEIWAYIENANPFDKAGSYAIQGEFSKYIDHIDGDYENVVGLPFYRIETLIKK